MFLKKYFTIYNADKKQISFYKKIIRNLDEEKEINNNLQNNKWIFIFLLLLLIIIVLVIGIFIGKQIYKERKKYANELNDDYLYESNKDEEDQSLYKGAKEEK